MSKNTLYITFDGLTDPLGQSQILPYLIGLQKNEFHITVLSCEKENALKQDKLNIETQIKGLNISWIYIQYKQEGNFLSRILYLKKLFNITKQLVTERKVDLIHCRSYLTALIGLAYKRKKNIPFVFDMRGYWADERIDGGIWQKSNPMHLFFYNYFKKKEISFIKESSAIVSLTHAAKKDLSKRFPAYFVEQKTTVIPCSVDVNEFNVHTPPKVHAGLNSTDFIFVYVGSIGTWYYTNEMIACFAELKKEITNAKLLILTKDTEAANALVTNFSNDIQKHIVVTKATYQQVPSYLALAKAAIFFIKPAYSKIASSPTKMAECWAMNLPIITNAGIGDNDLYFNQNTGGVLVSDFNVNAYRKAVVDFLNLNGANDYRKIALDFFNKDTAVKNYLEIYTRLTSS